MSFPTLAAAYSALRGVGPEPETLLPSSYDGRVNLIPIVSYYKLNSTLSIADQKGVINGGVVAGDLQDSQPTLAQLDNVGATCIGFPGLVQPTRCAIGYHAAHKTASGGVAILVQTDSIAIKQIILASDEFNSSGGWSLEITALGKVRFFLRQAGSVLQEVTSSASLVKGVACHLAATWGAAGMRLYINGTMAIGLSGVTSGANLNTSSETSIGAWHNDDDPFSGVLGRLAMFSGQPSDAEVLSLALPVSVTVANDVAIDADEDGPNVTVDALLRCHYAGTKAAATVTLPQPTGTLGVWSVSSNNLVYNPASTPGVDTAGRYTVNGSPSAVLTATVDDTTPAPGSNDHDALVMAAAGQISNAALQAADMYYWSGEINDTIRNTWNNLVNANRWDFDSSYKSPFSTNVNSKTRLYAVSYLHEAVIMPATPFADEVLQPSQLSNAGVLRHTTRNKSGWNYGDPAVRNFRKHQAQLRLRNPHSAYTSVNSGLYDRLLYNQTYESGFTFWQGGVLNDFRKGTGPALMQYHGDYAGVYFYVTTAGGTFTCFYKPASTSAAVYVPSFPMTTGYNDIHVLKFSVRLSSSGGGHIRIWYNGVQKVNANNISVTSGTSPLLNMCFTYRDPYTMDSQTGRSPSVAGGSETEPTIYTDRIWVKAV